MLLVIFALGCLVTALRPRQLGDIPNLEEPLDPTARARFVCLLLGLATLGVLVVLW